MPNLILFFSHNLTGEQEEDAKVNLKCENIISLPDDLQKLWSQIPPEGELPKGIIEKFTGFLIDNSKENDFVLIQGEFGVTCYMVNWCFQNNRIPIYATTKRVANEMKNENGEVELIKIFKHVRFRKYIK